MMKITKNEAVTIILLDKFPKLPNKKLIAGGSMIDTEKYEKMTTIMKAMSHATRLFILDKLNEREHCVCELQELLECDMSTVSKHLSILKNAGLINSRKFNNQVFYKLLCPCVLDFYNCMCKIK